MLYWDGSLADLDNVLRRRTGLSQKHDPPGNIHWVRSLLCQLYLRHNSSHGGHSNSRHSCDNDGGDGHSYHNLRLQNID